MKRSLLAMSVIITLIIAGTLMSNNLPSTGGNDSRTQSADTAPLQFGNIPEFTLTYPNRQMAVYLNANSDNNAIEHEPVLMFNAVPNSKIKDMPFVKEIEETSDKTTVTFSISLSSPELRAKIRDHVLRPENVKALEKIWANVKSVTPDEIVVRREKVKELTVYFLLDQDTVIAFGQIANMDSYTDTGNARNSFELKVEFSADNWEKFKLNKNRITAIPFYGVFRSENSYARGNVEGSINVAKVIEESMNLKRDKIGQGLFLDEVKEIQSNIAAKIRVSITANDAKLFDNAMVAEKITNLLFTQRELSFEDLAKDPTINARFAEHIQPLIDKYNTLRAEQQREDTARSEGSSHTETDTHESSKTTTKAAAAGATVGVVSAGGAVSQSKTETDIHSVQDAIDTLKQELSSKGVQFTTSKDGKSFVPVAISIFTKSSGAESITLQQTINLEIKKKLDNCLYIKTSPVPVNIFPSEIVGFTIEPSAINLPVGTLLLYVGKTIPAGWEEWNPNGRFPNHSEILEELRGKEFPSLNGVLLGVGGADQRGCVERAVVKQLKPVKNNSLPYYEFSNGRQVSFVNDPIYNFNPNEHRPDYLKVRLIIKVRD